MDGKSLFKFFWNFWRLLSRFMPSTKRGRFQYFRILSMCVFTFSPLMRRRLWLRYFILLKRCLPCMELQRRGWISFRAHSPQDTWKRSGRRPYVLFHLTEHFISTSISCWIKKLSVHSFSGDDCQNQSTK